MENKNHDCCCGNDHKADHQHECGCGHDHEEELEYIYLTLDDDEEVKCSVLGIFEVDEKEYIALVPENEETVFIYKYDEDDNGPILSRIEDDEEFDIISEAFHELFIEEEEE